MSGSSQQQPPRPNGPDFSDIDSREKAEALFRRGELAKLFLMPLEFGGADNALNTLYAPSWAVEQKERLDTNVIGPLAEDGKITRYKAMPEYQGKSVIPIAIRIEASEPGQFTATINIWGDALSRAQDD